MGTRRTIYIFALAGAASFYILYPFWFSGYLFAVLLLLLPFDLIISLPGMLTRQIALAAPGVLEQGAEGTLIVTTIQNRLFPAKCIKIKINISGDGFSDTRRFVCGAERGNRYEMAIDTSHSGVIVYDLKRIWTVSLFGMFALPTPANRRAAILILPMPVKPPFVASLPRGVVFIPKPGGGFSEDYDLRPYRPGDQVRSIHWKVSAKVDSLIVREPLIPPPHGRFVEAMKWNSARERDVILGRLRWISDYLLKWELPYYVRLGDDAPVAEITKPGDLTEYIYRVLSGSQQAIQPPTSPPTHFVWVFRVDAVKGV